VNKGKFARCVRLKKLRCGGGPCVGRTWHPDDALCRRSACNSRRFEPPTVFQSQLSSAMVSFSSSTFVQTVSINYEDFNESFLTCGTCLCEYNTNILYTIPHVSFFCVCHFFSFICLLKHMPLTVDGSGTSVVLVTVVFVSGFSAVPDSVQSKTYCIRPRLNNLSHCQYIQRNNVSSVQWWFSNRFRVIDLTFLLKYGYLFGFVYLRVIFAMNVFRISASS
jgi:hypothetical protein